MRTGVFITARLGSSRLANKHMLAVDGVPIISFLIRRINAEFKKEIETGDVSVVICTSKETMNERFLELEGADVYFGSVHNIPLRHIQAASDNAFDQVIAVDGDDILCSKEAMRSVFEALNAGEKYVYTVNLPFGMNCFGYKTSFIKNCADKIEGLEVLETGWTRFFGDEEKKVIMFSETEPSRLLRFTLDYQEDFDFFNAVLLRLGGRVDSASDSDIIGLVQNDGFYRWNQNISEEYWRNFASEIERENSLNS